MQLDAKVPGGPLAEKWDRHRFELKLVNPANKRKYNIIVVGTGLAGSSGQPASGSQYCGPGWDKCGKELSE
jgi:hypothetical protein